MSGAEKSVYPGTGNRFGALLLDLLLLWVALFLIASVIASVMPDLGGPLGAITMLLVFLLYLAGLPLTPLQGTPGKRILGMRIAGRGGERLKWYAAVVRAGAMIAWIALISWASGFAHDAAETALLSAFFLPWVPAAFLPRRQTLFDLLAGTSVVRYKADAAAIAQEAAGKTRMVEGLATTVLFLAGGALLSVAVGYQRDHDRRVRVAYAVEQTASLREKVAEFRGREKRWPAAADLGVAEFTPYPVGGGYRLQPDGSIRISFSIIRELKGHDIVLSPVTAADGRIDWKCSAAEGLNRKYRPAICRNA